MTWLSERSGIASMGVVTSAQYPHAPTRTNTATVRNRFLSDNAMSLLTMSLHGHPTRRRARWVVLSSESANGQTTSYAERAKALGGGSSEETMWIARPGSVSGAVPATIEMNGTVGATLIDAVVRAHGSSQVKAQPSKAIPMGPVMAHMSKATRIS